MAMKIEQTSLEQCIAVFKRFDEKETGKIAGKELARVLKEIAAESKGGGLDIAGLIGAFGISAADTVSYAEFVSWLFCADEITKQSSYACQAAVDGDIETLRRIWEKHGDKAFKQSHFIRAGGGTMAGLISWGGAHAVHLQGLSEGPPMPAPAMALQYAALAGKTTVSKFLVEECGLTREDEGTLGASPYYIAKCHRLGIDDNQIVDEAGFEDIFEEEEECLILGSAIVQRVKTGRLS
jgi:hypothetical protein